MQPMRDKCAPAHEITVDIAGPLCQDFEDNNARPDGTT